MARRKGITAPTGIVPIYDIPFWVTNGADELSRLKRELNLADVDVEAESSTSMAITVGLDVQADGQTCQGLLFAFFQYDTGVIVHEACHGALMIYEYIGATEPVKEQEPFCYLLQFLVYEIEMALKK